MVSWREELIAEARTWLGTPYHPEGRIKGVGVDCGGLVYELYNPHFGPFAPYPRYSSDWGLHGNEEKYLDFIKPHVVPVERPIMGSISLFHLGRAYAHAAIYMGNEKYIHAWGRPGQGHVTITPARVMRTFAKGHPIKHFDPVTP